MSSIDLLKQKLKSQEIKGVVAFGGSERALIDDAINYLRSEFLSEDLGGLNHHRLLAGENDVLEAISTLRTMPFLSKWRLVEFYNAEKLTALEITPILDYLEKPSETSLLVLVFNKIDKRNKLITTLSSKNYLHVCEVAGEQERISFILNEARNCHIKMHNETAQFLSLVLDNDLLMIKEAIKKLSLLFENKEISINDIEANILSHHDHDAFILAKAISEGKLTDSLYTLGLLRNKRENALKFLGLLMWQFRILLQIRHCLDKGMAEWDIRKQVSVFGERFTWMAHVARQRNIEFHITRLTRLIECDLALKTQRISEPFSFIEKAVYQSVLGL